VLAFAATGEGPFGTGSGAALIYRLVHNPPDLDRVPIETRPLIERCLDKDPGRRPSPRELLAELGGAGLAPGWLPQSLIRDVSQPGPAMSAPPAFGSPSPSPSAPFPAAPVPFPVISGGPEGGAAPAETGGIMANGARTGAPENPPTVTGAHLSRPAVPPWPRSVSDVMPAGGRRPPGRRRPLVIAGLAATLVAVTGGVTAGVVFRVTIGQETTGNNRY
jgi:serine/threonine protein kinase